MKKILGILICFAMVSCTAAGVGGQPKPDSVTGVAINITGNYTQIIPTRNVVVGVVNGITFINESSQVWSMTLDDYINENYQSWIMLSSIPQGVTLNQIANNSFGILFAGTTVGSVYRYNTGTWQSYATTSESSAISSMVIASGNSVFAGNESGNVWYYTTSWSKLTSTPFNGRVKQLAIDSISAPQYIGVAVGSNVYACQFSNNACGSWKNLITEVGSLYTDTGSTINAIAFNQLSGASYGYLGNSKGHIWRGVYQGSSVTSFLDMTTFYTGYTDTSAVTALQVISSNNVLFAGTQAGRVFIWTPTSLAWSEITPTNSTKAITAIALIDSNNIVVTNSQGQIWSINWK